MSSSGARILAVTFGLAVFTAAPSFAYWDDAHYDLTYYLARAVGYTPQQAYRVAAADLSVDYSDATEPVQMSVADYALGVREDAPEKQVPRWRFHALRNEIRFPGSVGNAPNAMQADNAMFAQEGALHQVARSSESTNPGVYMHFFQDEWPHRGFGSAHGHYFDTGAPEASVKQALAAGLPIGGSTDWLSFPPDRSVPLNMANRVAERLGDFLHEVSPRQRLRSPRQDLLAGLMDALRAANPAPASLRPEEFAPYIAYVKAAHGYGKAPDLTPEQQERFRKHSEGPNLAAAEARVMAALKQAGMLEPSFPGYLHARKEYTFDATGAVAPAQLNQWVLTGSLRVTIKASKAGAQPPVQMVIIEPPDCQGEAEYELTKPTTMAVPSTGTWEQIPIGEVTVELRRDGKTVTRQEHVAIKNRGNEVTLSAEAVGRWVLVKTTHPAKLRTADPIADRGRVIGRMVQSLTATTCQFDQSSDTTDFHCTLQFDVPPAELVPGQAYPLKVTGRATTNRGTDHAFAGFFRSVYIQNFECHFVGREGANATPSEVNRPGWPNGFPNAFVPEATSTGVLQASEPVSFVDDPPNTVKTFDVVLEMSGGQTPVLMENPDRVIYTYQWQPGGAGGAANPTVAGGAPPAGTGPATPPATPQTAPAATGPLATGPAPSGDRPPATVGAASGTVSVQAPGGAWQPIGPGGVLPPRSTIRTGPDGSVSLLRPPRTITLAPNTTVYVDDRGALKLRNGQARVITNLGGGSAERDFQIGTSAATITDTHTDFTVQHDARRLATTVFVTEGSVVVTPYNTTLRVFTLRPGLISVITPLAVSTMVNYRPKTAPGPGGAPATPATDGGPGAAALGFRIGRQGGKWITTAVQDDTKAAAAGLLPGDVLTAVNGKPTDGLGDQQVRDLVTVPAGTPLRFDLTRPADGRTFWLTVTLGQG